VSTFMAQSRGIVPVKSTVVASSMVTDHHQQQSRHVSSNYEADLQEEEEGEGEESERSESYDGEDQQGHQGSDYDSGEDQFDLPEESHDFTDAAA
jgi:hypothetical protein